MAHRGPLLGGVSGSQGGVFSSRIARFVLFFVVACVALLTYQVVVLTKRCGLYENRMVTYEAQIHRIHLEKAIADKRADSYRQQAIASQDIVGSKSREAADSVKRMIDLRNQLAEVKAGEKKAQQELETAKNLVNERNEFLTRRETSYRADLGQIMQDLESCKSKLSPGQHLAGNIREGLNRGQNISSVIGEPPTNDRQLNALQSKLQAVKELLPYRNENTHTFVIPQNSINGQSAQQSVAGNSLNSGGKSGQEQELVSVNQQNSGLKSGQEKKEPNMEYREDEEPVLEEEQLKQGLQKGQGPQMSGPGAVLRSQEISSVPDRGNNVQQSGREQVQQAQGSPVFTIHSINEGGAQQAQGSPVFAKDSVNGGGNSSKLSRLPSDENDDEK